MLSHAQKSRSYQHDCRLQAGKLVLRAQSLDLGGPCSLSIIDKRLCHDTYEDTKEWNLPPSPSTDSQKMYTWCSLGLKQHHSEGEAAVPGYRICIGNYLEGLLVTLSMGDLPLEG